MATFINFGNLKDLVLKLTDPKVSGDSAKRLIIAGGFIRDLSFGIAPKDIDLYCLGGYPPATAVLDLKEANKELFEGATYQTFDGEYPNEWAELPTKDKNDGLQRQAFDDNVNSLVKVTLACGITLDIILLHNKTGCGAEVVKTFDLECNAVWYDQLISKDYFMSYASRYSATPIHKDLNRVNTQRVNYLKEKLEGKVIFAGIDNIIKERDMLNNYRKMEDENRALKAQLACINKAGKRKPDLQWYKEQRWGDNANVGAGGNEKVKAARANGLGWFQELNMRAMEAQELAVQAAGQHNHNLFEGNIVGRVIAGNDEEAREDFRDAF